MKTHTNKCFAKQDEAHNECTCDGYHTFEELYDHRFTLYIALCRKMAPTNKHLLSYGFVWRSKQHHDGDGFEGWFVLGIGEKAGYQITYHIPLERWNETEFAKTLDKAPEWDGHTSDDVLQRLKKL